MGALLIEAETGRNHLEDVRGEIDAALDRHLPAGFIDCRWEGEVMRITGPGARGTLAFVAGRLRVQGSLSPPASLFQPMIERKIRAAIAEVFGSPALR